MPQFRIIHGPKAQPKDTWVPLEPARLYENPQEANVEVKRLNETVKRINPNHAYMIERLPDKIDVGVREANRADYQPFEIQGKPYHYAELTSDKMISFYVNAYNAYDDKRSTMKLGRYLRQFTNKSDQEIGEICARYGVEFADATVHFAKTREEIKHVYENGPDSCMASPAECFSTGKIHPAEAYASGDFEVAYLKRDDRITARTVIIPSKKKYISIYGDYSRMRPMLEELGYSRNHDDEQIAYGLKLLKLAHGNKLALPFLDFSGRVSYYDDDEKYLIIGAKGGWASEFGYVFDDLSQAEDPYDNYDDYYEDY